MDEVESIGAFSSSSQNGAKPKSFKLDDQVFVCKATMPGWEYLHHSKALATGGLGDHPVIEFFNACMEPDEFKRFHEYVTSPDRFIHSQTLVDICTNLVGAYGKRPT